VRLFHGAKGQVERRNMSNREMVDALISARLD